MRRGQARNQGYFLAGRIDFEETVFDYDTLKQRLRETAFDKKV